MVTVTCAHCAKQRQVTVTYRQRSVTGVFFCGNECKWAYEGKVGRPTKRQPRVQVECFACGKPKAMKESAVAKNTTGRFFCSLECLATVGSNPRRKQDIECPHCRILFYPTNKDRFCSLGCYEAYLVAKRATFVCQTCNKTFERKPSQIRTNTHWCSRACRAIAQTTTAVGDRWHNGKRVRRTQDGYLLLWEPYHPDSRKDGWILEHRLVVTQKHGQPVVTMQEIEAEVAEMRRAGTLPSPAECRRLLEARKRMD